MAPSLIQIARWHGLVLVHHYARKRNSPFFFSLLRVESTTLSRSLGNFSCKSVSTDSHIAPQAAGFHNLCRDHHENHRTSSRLRTIWLFAHDLLKRHTKKRFHHCNQEPAIRLACSSRSRAMHGNLLLSLKTRGGVVATIRELQPIGGRRGVPLFPSLPRCVLQAWLGFPPRLLRRNRCSHNKQASK